MYQAYPVSNKSGEGKTEFLKTQGAGFKQEVKWEGSGKRAGQLNLCAETINPLKEQI